MSMQIKPDKTKWSWDNRIKDSGRESLTTDIKKALDKSFKEKFAGRVLNVRPDIIDFRDKFYVPSLLSLKEKITPPKIPITAIRNQKDEGSCTGQALAAVIDFQIAQRKQDNQEWLQKAENRRSARMLYEMARAHDEWPDDRLPGSSLRGALKGFYHNGSCAEQFAPYDPGEPAWQLEIDMAKNARSCGLGAYFRLRHILYDYQAALNEVGVIFCSSIIHTGWKKSNVKKNNGKIQQIDQNYELAGGHAFAIVGYDQDGFLVLNSWGKRWGGYEGYHGIAHWSYKDWQRHVLDAWVLRIQYGNEKNFKMSGGWAPPEDIFSKYGSVPTTPRTVINGHYIHLKNGRLVKNGAFNCDKNSFQKTTDLLKIDGQKDENPKYNHLLFIVEDIHDDLKTLVRRAAVDIPHLKSKGIYPIYVIWEHETGQNIKLLLEAQATGIQKLTGDSSHLVSRRLEEFACQYLSQHWKSLLDQTAYTMFDKDDKADTKLFKNLDKEKFQGELWSAIKLLWTAADRKKKMDIHVLSYGAGAWIVGNMAQYATQKNIKITKALKSINLVAPTIDKQWFLNAFLPIRKQYNKNGEKQKIALYTLSHTDEEKDVFGAYHHTWPRLVEKALFSGKFCTGLYETAKHLDQNGQADHFHPDRNQPHANSVTAHTYSTLRNDRYLLHHIIEKRITKPSA